MPVEAVDSCVEDPGRDALAVGHDQGVERADALNGGRHQRGCRSGIFEIRFEEFDGAGVAAQLSGEVLRVVRPVLHAEPLVVGPPERQRQLPPVDRQSGRNGRTDAPPPSDAGDQPRRHDGILTDSDTFFAPQPRSVGTAHHEQFRLAIGRLAEQW